MFENDPTRKYALCWAVALAPEAKAIRELRKLNVRVMATPFSIYRNDDATEYVVQTGIGKVKMAMGVGYLAGRFESSVALVWGNVGVAGARSRMVGSVWAVHQVIDAVSKRTYYPGLIPIRTLQSMPCCTVNTVETVYAEDFLYEMEAASFLEATRRVSHIDAVAVLKIVSDTPETGTEKLTPKDIKTLVLTAKPTVLKVATQLRSIAEAWNARHAHPPYFDEALKIHRFTAAQQIRLLKLMRRWSILSPEDAPLDFMRDCTRREVLDALESHLDAIPLEIGCD